MRDRQREEARSAPNLGKWVVPRSFVPFYSSLIHSLFAKAWQTDREWCPIRWMHSQSDPSETEIYRYLPLFLFYIASGTAISHLVVVNEMSRKFLHHEIVQRQNNPRNDNDNCSNSSNGIGFKVGSRLRESHLLCLAPSCHGTRAHAA